MQLLPYHIPGVVCVAPSGPDTHFLESMKMKYTTHNSFITHECERLAIEPAPIATNIQETYSQCNEDLIIEALLRAIMLRSGREMQSVRYMEIGANHPVQTSATYLFSKNHGAKGVLVEAIPKLAERLASVRPNDVVLNCAVTNTFNATVEFYVHEKDELSSVSVQHISKFSQFGGEQGIVGKLTIPNVHINELMRRHGADLDFLSVDVEGLDADLIAAMDTVFQPSIIQCEHGGKIEEFYRLFGTRDYVIAGITDVNLIAVKRGMI